MSDFDNGDVIRLGCVLEVESLHEIVNVLHCQLPGGANKDFAAVTSDIQEYCDTLYARIESELSDLVFAKHISIKNMTQSTVWGNIAWDVFAQGGEVAEVTALQVCCLGFARTPLSRVQIRKYLGPFTEVDMVDGVWNGVVRGACDLFMTDHIDSLVMTGGLTLLGVAYRPSDGRVTLATSASTSANPVIQRRRRRGRGS